MQFEQRSASPNRTAFSPRRASQVRVSALLVATFALVVIGPALGQTPDPFEPIYTELDHRLEKGEGLVSAPPRPEVDPSTANRLPDADDDPLGMQDQEARWAAVEERMAERQRKQLEAYAQEVRAECGRAQLEDVSIGMSERRFQGCTVQARHGGVSHIVTLERDGGSARLYVLGVGAMRRIYVVDGVVRALRPEPPRARLPQLQRLSVYPSGYPQPYVVAVGDGRYLLFGQILGEDWGLPTNHRIEQLSDRLRRINTSVPPPPLQWEDRLQGWLRTPRTDACRGRWDLHTLSVLPSAQVLVAGGLCDISRLLNEPGEYAPHLATAIWDAEARSWRAGPSLREARIFHTATVLADGRILMVGGLGDPLHRSPLDPLGSTEFISAQAGEIGPSLRQPRAQHSASLLPDGSIAVLGGRGPGGETLNSLEIWNPRGGAWELRASMQQPRRAHAASVLGDGRILVSGGIGNEGEALHSTEFYDPVGDAWTPGPPLPQHLQGHGSAVLDDGTVILAGGWVERPNGESAWLAVLRPGATHWQRTGVRSEVNSISRNLAHQTQIVPMGAGRALLFTESEIMLWRDEVTPGAGAADRVKEPSFSTRMVDPVELQPSPVAPPPQTAPARGLRTGPVALGLAALTALAAALIWRRRRALLPQSAATWVEAVSMRPRRVVPESADGTLLFLKLLAVPLLAALLNQVFLLAADGFDVHAESQYGALTLGDQARLRFIAQVQVTLILTVLVGKPLLTRWARSGRDQFRHWLGAWLIVHAPVGLLYLLGGLPWSLRLGMIASLFGSLFLVCALWWRWFYTEPTALDATPTD